MSTTETDLYELLGVSRDADGATIKSAYRKLAMSTTPTAIPAAPKARASSRR